MTLDTLRNLMLDHLHDWQQDHWNADGSWTRVDRLLNEAYRTLVARLERTGSAWNLAGTPITVAVTAGTREYALDADPAVRRVVDCFQVQSDGRRAPQLHVYDFGQRNDGRDGVYVFRAADDTWHLGLRDYNPPAQTLEVSYEPILTEMSAPADVPAQIPAMHQYVIALLAAVKAKGVENRDESGLAGDLAAALDAFDTETDRLTHRSQGRRL